jgi:hypothetical protein
MRKLLVSTVEPCLLLQGHDVHSNAVCTIGLRRARSRIYYTSGIQQILGLCDLTLPIWEEEFMTSDLTSFSFWKLFYLFQKIGGRGKEQELSERQRSSPDMV